LAYITRQRQSLEKPPGKPSRTCVHTNAYLHPPPVFALSQQPLLHLLCSRQHVHCHGSHAQRVVSAAVMASHSHVGVPHSLNLEHTVPESSSSSAATAEVSMIMGYAKTCN
jgi:hypothetical protein